MAMRKCRECGHEVSSKAKTCPNCGIKNPGRRAVRPGTVLAVVIGFFIVWAMSLGDSTTPTTQGSTSQPSGSESQSGYVDLPGSVSFDGQQFTIRNQGSYDWTDCEMSINAGVISGGYDLNAGRIEAENTYTVGAMQFTKDGERFNPFTHKPEDFDIYCDTPRGRGSYHGSWQ